MHRTTTRAAGIAAAALLALTSSTAPVGAASNWKSLRNDEGERIRWHSCTVEYAVDMNGYSSSRRKEINAAIRDTEAASGVDFVRVPWSRADLKISLMHRSSGKRVASTQSWLNDDEYTKSRIRVYPQMYSYGYNTRVDVYRHEFGHALGLDHVGGWDTMNAEVIRNPSQSGWRAGLRWLYRGC